MFTLFSKLAEPPPPNGMPVDEWDKHLGADPARGTIVAKTSAPINLIRKTASRQAFEELTAPRVVDTPALSLKLAAVDDLDLFKVATDLASDVDEALQLYENMGGTFEKSAFGAPMFGQNQMAGSPALQAGMTPKAPNVGAAVAAIKPPAQANPAAAQGGQGGGAPMSTTTTTKQVVAPSTPSTPSTPAAPSAPAQS